MPQNSIIEDYLAVCRTLRYPPLPGLLIMMRDYVQECAAVNKNLPHINLSGNNNALPSKARLKDVDAHVLLSLLPKVDYIVSVDLSYNNITDEGAKCLAKLMEVSPVLLFLKLTFNDITTEGIKYFCKALLTNTTLLGFWLNHNKIGSQGGFAMAKVLQRNRALELLDLSSTDLEIKSLVALATVMRSNNTLKILNVSRPLIQEEDDLICVHFYHVLVENSTLCELHLQYCDIWDSAVTRLVEGLEKNTTLKYLDISCNRISQDGAEQIGLVLKLNTPLQTLNLGYNRISSVGAQFLSNALHSSNKNLINLSVVKNQIDYVGLCSLATALEVNTTLKRIFIWGNKITEPAAIAFKKLLQTKRLLKEDVDVQPYVVDDVTYLAELCHSIPSQHYEFLTKPGIL